MSVLLNLGVPDGVRTHNFRNHNPMLCQLNYGHHQRSKNCTWDRATEDLHPFQRHCRPKCRQLSDVSYANNAQDSTPETPTIGRSDSAKVYD